jgi:putative adenylate-forming enzyme
MGPTGGRAAALAHYLAARHRRFPEREALLEWQRPRLAAALRRAVRFPRYAGLAGAALADFPVLDKAAWLADFAGLNARGLSLDICLGLARAAEAGRAFDTRLAGLSVGLSSGTSGSQAAFLTSAAERARWAGTMLARALPDGLAGGARIALVLRAGGPLYDAVGGGRVSFRFIDLYEPLERQVAALAEFAPTVLAAPPVLLDLLAAERTAGRLRIAPRLVYSVADVLDPDVAQRVAAAFGVAVGQVYQATEGFLGITCAAGTLHLNEDLLHFEEEPAGPGRFVPVVTDLFRTSQAVIRYRMGDVLVAAGACGCGSPLRPVAAVEGRSDDVLRLARAGRPSPCFADLVRGAVLGAGAGDFQLVQTGAGSLVLAVAGDGWEAARDALAAALARAGFDPVRIERGEFTAPAPGEKRRRVRREAAASGG